MAQKRIDENKILKFLTDNPKSTALEIGAYMELSPNSIRTKLKKMTVAGNLRMKRDRNVLRYDVAPQTPFGVSYNQSLLNDLLRKAQQQRGVAL